MVDHDDTVSSDCLTAASQTPDSRRLVAVDTLLFRIAVADCTAQVVVFSAERRQPDVSPAVALIVVSWCRVCTSIGMLACSLLLAVGVGRTDAKSFRHLRRTAGDCQSSADVIARSSCRRLGLIAPGRC